LEASGKYQTNVDEYLTKSLSYEYDAAKKQALALFLDYLAKL
jgi:hypothetical protein